MSEELRAAAERLAKLQDSHLFTCEEDGDTRTRGSSGVGVSWKLWREIKLVVAWAVQRLTAPLPDDLEAELQAVAKSIAECVLRRTPAVPPLAFECIIKDLEPLLRPLLQRAAGGRAEISNITVCWLPHQSHPFVHGALHGRDVWLCRDGSWTEDESSEMCNLDASRELAAGVRADDGEPLTEGT